MVVTATEFKKNMGTYFELVQREDIIITKNGKKVGVLVNPGVRTVEKLIGIIKLPDELEDIDYKEIKEMRLREKYGYND